MWFSFHSIICLFYLLELIATTYLQPFPGDFPVCCDGSCFFLILCFIYLNLDLKIYMEKNITATRRFEYIKGKNMPIEKPVN